MRSDAVQRRPIIHSPEWDSTKENLLDHRVTSLCQIDTNRILVGDSAGYIQALDLRRISKTNDRCISANVGRFNGPAGSVRQIVKHENLPIVACVGLDRMMRTYDVNTRKQLDCVYLKQRLNCMLFCTDGTWNTNEEGVDEKYGTMDGNSGSFPLVGGGIDDDDEVEDYVDSSAEGGSDDDESASSGPMVEENSGSEESDGSSTSSEEIQNHMREKKKRRL